MSKILAMEEILGTLQRAVDEHAAYPLDVDSGLGGVELADRQNPYVRIEVRFLPADQVELGAPTVKQWGQIWLEVLTKEGESWRPPLELIDFLHPYFNCKRLGNVLCLAAGSMPMKTKDGFDRWPMIVNFYYHTRG